MVELAEPGAWERMVADYAAMDLSPQWHPLGLLRPYLDRRLSDARRIHHMPDGGYAALPGMVVTRQRPHTAQGFLFLLLEDETGLVNVIVSPRLYQKYRPVVRTEPFLLIRGRVQHPRPDDRLNLIAVDIQPLGIPEAVRRRPLARGVHLAPLFDRHRWPDLDDASVPTADGMHLIDQARLIAPPAHSFR